MKGFMKKFNKKDDKNKNTPSNDQQNNNPLQQFQNIFQPNQNKNNNSKSYGGGVALGTGSTSKLPPGTTLVEIELKQNDGSEVGIFIEHTESNGAIISKVMPNSAGEKAGFMRGDVICFPGSEGMEEMNYNQFLIMLKERSTHSLHFEVRRVAMKGSSNQGGNTNGMSTDAFVKRQAVIAAAEQRNMKNKAKTTTTKQHQPSKDSKAKNNTTTPATETSSAPMSDEAKRAVEAAKVSEARDVQNLGFNPYEATAVQAGQAKKAVADVIHGEINNSAEISTPAATTATPTAVKTSPPSSNTATSGTSNDNKITPPLIPLSIHEEFDTAFSTYLASNSNNNNSKTSLSILSKLITNALTKPDIDKFRRVRLSNPKIHSNIVDTEGAMDIMMVFGFLLVEEDSEMCLVYNCGNVYEEEENLWKIQALDYMKQCL